jgi:hypothetical protein
MKQSVHISDGQGAQRVPFPVDKVWAATYVWFSLVTKGNQQYVAYYDQYRQFSIASRRLGTTNWAFKKLECCAHSGWDNHNYIAMAVDRNDFLHVSGNMHGGPLIYFRSTKPRSIDLVRADMTGLNETRVTYPVFFHNATGDLFYSFRFGTSGNGHNYYNVYDPAKKQWKRLVHIFDGHGARNAYPSTPLMGPDGYYYVLYVWREHFHAETNCDLSYIRSKDLVSWETISGKPLELPITRETPGAVVDGVPVRGGLLNGGASVGHTPANEPVVSYFKYDGNGFTQIYFARFIEGSWRIFQATQWDHRFNVVGGGTLVSEVMVGPLQVVAGRWLVAVQHPRHGGMWEVDPSTMRLETKIIPRTVVPEELTSAQADFPGVHVHWTADNDLPVNGHYRRTYPEIRDLHDTYLLRWEAMPAYRDGKRPKPWLNATHLSVVEFKHHRDVVHPSLLAKYV